MKKLSIICPVRQASKTLPRLLKSYEEQTFFSDCVAYFVLSPSNDDSESILVSFCSAFPGNAKLVKLSEPQFPSLSRKKGIEASGEPYIAFMDADDALSPIFAETIIHTLDKGYDAVDFSFYINTREKTRKYMLRGKEKGLNKYEALRLLMGDSSMRGFLWSKAFKRELVNSETIFLDQPLFEDLPIAFIAFAQANKIAYLNDCLYTYFKHDGSAMRGNNRDRPRQHLASFAAVVEYASHSDDSKFLSIVKKAYFRMKLSLRFDIYLAKRDGMNKEEKIAIYHELKKLKRLE